MSRGSAMTQPTSRRRFSWSWFAVSPGSSARREGSFRAWVRGITVNVVRNHRRRLSRRPAVGMEPFDAFLDGLAEPNSELAREWDLDHDRHIFQKLQTSRAAGV